MPLAPNIGMQLELLDGVVGAVRAGLVVFDGDERVVLWNHWIEQHSRLPAAAVLGKTFSEVFPEMAEGRTHIALREALRNNFASLISQTLNKAPFPLYANETDAAADNRLQQAVHVIPLEVGTLPRHCLVQIGDVSMAVARERKLREIKLELESQTWVDGLTGIANRRRFDMHLEDELRRAKRSGAPLSLIMIDADHFKDFNDHFGHVRGDECLARIAATLAAGLHRSRDLVARYGGEEFAVILPDTDTDGALRVGEAMRTSIEALGIEHPLGGSARRVTVSIGIGTLIPDQAATSRMLLKNADRALYRAKRAGRNQVVVYTDF